MMHTVKKVSTLSMAKFMAVYMALLGLIMGIMLMVISSVVSPMLARIPEEAELDSLVSAVNFGWMSVIISIVVSTILGFIIGASIASIYNLIAKLTGGIKLDLETEEKKPQQIPTPQQYPQQNAYQQYPQYRQYQYPQR